MMRRRPRQRRSQETYEAILDGFARVAGEREPGSITTNHVAEAAGVSIGSLYQYFADKTALLQAVHDRHVRDVDRAIAGVATTRSDVPLREVALALLDALVDAHANMAALHSHLQLLPAPKSPSSSGQRLANRLHDALHTRANPSTVFVASCMIATLAHVTTLQRPVDVTLAQAHREARRLLTAYLSLDTDTDGP